MSANGRLEASELTSIGNGMRLADRAANAWLAMVAAAKKAGVTLWAAYPYGAYRDIAAQKAIYQGKGNQSHAIGVAAPGYSTHGDGNRVDVGSFGSAFGAAGVARRKWVLAHMGTFGFYREFGENDPNHLRHNGKIVSAPAAAATPKPIKIERQAMTATMPVTYKDTKTGKQTWARKRDTVTGGVIERTTEKGVVATWKAEVGCADLTSMAANAQSYIKRWTVECATDKAALTKLLTGAVIDVKALAAQIAAAVDVDSAEDIADAVADELAERMSS